MPPSPLLPRPDQAWLPPWLCHRPGLPTQRPPGTPGQQPPGSSTGEQRPPVGPPKPAKPPTEPKPTEPKPTEPKPTEPKPTEPKPTEPKPTEPKPTEPKPTDPKPVPPRPGDPRPVPPRPGDPRPVPPRPEDPRPVPPRPVDPADPVQPVDPADPVEPVRPGGRVDAYEVARVPTTGSGGGQGDDRGNLYVADGNTVKIFNARQEVTGTVAIPAGAVDVAPAPDGKSMFVVSREGNRYLPQKYVKAADGSWSKDAAFKLEPFEYGGRMHQAEGMRIATDAKGNLFVADGVWSSNSLNTVIKFDQDGKYITRFGEYVEGNPQDASSWEQGKFYWSLGGIAVSRDGNSVYTTEVGNNRVQRWDVNDNGTYVSTKMWGNTQETDPNRAGDSRPGMFAAPYDIGVDQWGDVYVVNTTVSQIQKFTPDGEHILSMNVGRTGQFREGERAHGLAVDMQGNALSTETGMVMRRTEAETREVPPMRETPTPDTTAPTLNAITVAEFADGPTIKVRVDATDDRRPAEVRTALEDGTWGPWRPYAPEIDVTLSDGTGVKGVAVQVRDAAGNESESIYRTLLRRA